MKNIKHLPKSVHSSLRSSVILFDLPRIVEELICNSVDSCATKIFVSVSIGGCSVKVEDDGCGITRDGLVLLGERHASSKLDLLTSIETDVESLGFRGEALGCLSDISLVEVRTKARGKPNAYCKIIKGWKCLFLGINNQREGVGTTVVVRDLFYNQPVRRKYMHSRVMQFLTPVRSHFCAVYTDEEISYCRGSPKNVLHSLKKCVLRAALVHPQISFRVMDIESEDELLCTIPSPSPLRLVYDSFGSEVSSCLHEVAFADRVMKLSGYISGPTNAFSTKAFQYLYINSRFVCKGPVHNLLNNLAASLQCQLALQRVEPQMHGGKRQRSQGYPAYMLNLCCPLSSYDLTFEPSKTIVEFKVTARLESYLDLTVDSAWKPQVVVTHIVVRTIISVINPDSRIAQLVANLRKVSLLFWASPNDWSPVLSFFEQAIRNFWKELLAKSLGGKTFFSEDSKPIEGNFNDGSELIGREIQEEGTSKGSRIRKGKHNLKGKHNFQFYERSPVHSPATKSLGILSEAMDIDHKQGNSLGVSSIFFPELKPCQFKTGHVPQNEHFFQDVLCSEQHAFVSADKQIGFTKTIPQYSIHDSGSFLAEDQFLSDREVNEKYNISGLACQNDSREGDRCFNTGSTHSTVTPDSYGIMDNAQDAPFPLVCQNAFSKLGRTNYSLMETEQVNLFGGNFRNFRHRFSCFDGADANGACYNNGILNSGMSPLLEHAGASTPFLNVLKASCATQNFDASLDGLLHHCSRDCLCGNKGNTLNIELANQVCESGSDHVSTETEWFLSSPHSMADRSLMKVDDVAPMNESSGNFRSIKHVCCRKDASEESKNDFPEFFNFEEHGFHERLPDISFKKAKLGHKYCSSSKENVCCECHPDYIIHNNVFSSRKLNDETGKTGSLCNNINNIGDKDKYLRPSLPLCVQNDHKIGERLLNKQTYRDCQLSHQPVARSRRSCSAPPFYRGKRRYSILNDHLMTKDRKETCFQLTHDSKNSPENICPLNELLQPCNSWRPYPEATFDEAPHPCLRQCTGSTSVRQETNGAQNNKEYGKAHSGHIPSADALEDVFSGEMECATVTFTKWRNCDVQHTDGDMPRNKLDHQDDILDISSGLLHLAGGSLVPEYINKYFLEDARVLLQLDKKFIPVMARGTLVILDQHAADERIRLEELRRKVISGEGCSITYLDTEQDLVLPEVGLQLLQNYAEQIHKWGWICNIYSQCSESFAKNMNHLKSRSCGVTLVAVPCILGINLTDKDLTEFLEQLAETDGSSMLPPSVLRVLNFKACRGAIMFGDSLLPSECSLIVEELKATSLCFQCAHGRPTAVPLLDMASLHEQLSKLEKRMGRTRETWHGLCQHRPSIERAQQRLASAKKFQNG